MGYSKYAKMKVTKESINDLPVTIREKRLLNALLIDLKEMFH